jgi:hypothetical protein
MRLKRGFESGEASDRARCRMPWIIRLIQKEDHLHSIETETVRLTPGRIDGDDHVLISNR